MPKKKDEKDEFVEAVVEQPAPDPATALYKDRAGPKLGDNVSEGAANFGAITADAIAAVAAANKADRAAE